MNDSQSPIPTISCATPTPPTRQSSYAWASIWVGSVAALWLIISGLAERALPFDIYKQNRIGVVAALLAVILAGAGYCQHHRQRQVCHVALILSVVMLLIAMVETPA